MQNLVVKSTFTKADQIKAKSKAVGILAGTIQNLVEIRVKGHFIIKAKKIIDREESKFYPIGDDIDLSREWYRVLSVGKKYVTAWVPGAGEITLRPRPWGFDKTWPRFLVEATVFDHLEAHFELI